MQEVKQVASKQEIVLTKPESDFQFLSELEEDSEQISPLFENNQDFQMPEFNINLNNFGIEQTPRAVFEQDDCMRFNFDDEQDFSPAGAQFKVPDMAFDHGFANQLQCETPKSLAVDFPAKEISCLDDGLKRKSKSFQPATKVKIQVNDTESVKSEEKKKGLALRADVMNKNLIRAIRRECKAIYESYLKANTLSNSRSKRIFKSNLKKFSEHLLQTTSVEWRTRADFDVKEFHKYLGIFINTCLMKKLLDDDTEQDKVSEFNDLLYSYSHKKYNDYIAVAEVSTVIKIIFEHSQVSGFIDTYPTLSVNKAEYESHIAKMLRHI